MALGRSRPPTPPPGHRRTGSDGGLSDCSDTTPEGLTCAICFNLLLNPVLWPAQDRAQCSHAFCEGCTHEVLARSFSVCPLCRAPAIENAAASLTIDEDTLGRLQREAPARHAARTEEYQRELHLRATLPELFLYCTGGKYKLKNAQVLELKLTRACDLWLVVKLLMTGTRKVGLLVGAEAPGSEGYIASVMNLPFKTTSMSLEGAVGKVAFEKKVKGTVTLKLRVSAEKFKAVFMEQPAPEAEEEAWQFVAANSSGLPARLRVAKVQMVQAGTLLA